MPERDGYAHGIPSWVDLGTTDVEAAKKFYGALFGWTSEDQPTDMGMPYTMFSKNGKAVAGGSPLPPDMAEQGAPPMWNSYINVDSVDETISKVEDAGGSVVMPAMDVMTAGRMAFIADPTGAAIGLWQVGDHKGAELINEHGAFTWNELVTDDTASAQKFFSEALGWSAQTDQLPDGSSYTSFSVGERVTAGMMEKTAEMGPIPNAWGVYFAVDDCEDCVSQIGELGGNIIMAPFDTPVGKMSVAQDPQGAVFSIIQMSQEALERA